MNILYAKKSVYRTWLLLCFTTGPVSSMVRTYIPAVLQTMARSLGFNSNGEKCSITGNDCFILVGSWKIRSNSYVLYLKALFTLVESIISLLMMNIADYSSYRKWFICILTVLYGALSIPFIQIKGDSTKSQLYIFSALYCLTNITNTLLQILEASYIPSFMRSFTDREIESNVELLGNSPEEIRRSMILKKGSKVSVMGSFLGNVGGMVALLIGLIISYSNSSGSNKHNIDGFHNFLIAITCAGSITLVFGVSMFYFIPSIKNQEKPKDEFLIFLTIKRTWMLFKQIRNYPNAFLFCLGWVIWNLTFNTFMGIFVLLFRSTLGIGSSDSEYTVYTWLSYVIASLGSLFWMYLYPRMKLKIKTWAYIFLGFALFTQFWASLGISNSTKFGFKSRWEFWLFDVFYSSSSSALRCLNRTVYSSMLPIGDEAQFFGLEVILGNLFNWGIDFLMAFIQDKTNNDRYPFLLNFFLVCISILLYFKSDTDQGLLDAEKLTSETINPETPIRTIMSTKHSSSQTTRSISID